MGALDRAARGVVKLGAEVGEDVLDMLLRRDTLRGALDARASQMDLPTNRRTLPRPDRTRVVDTDYMNPAPAAAFDDLSQFYPRNPDPSARLPLGDRSRVLIDRRSEIAARLADRIRETGQMDAPTRYFYHSDGPLYRAARSAGLSDEEAQLYLRDFANTFAATSPRTEVESNVRNATLAMSKDAAGVPIREIMGPGTVGADGAPGISERGYPMMTSLNPQKPGIHGQLLDQVLSGRNIDTNSNTKPAIFGNNMVGNRSGATIDTHAIRGVLQTLNQIEPGAVPEGFILPQFRDAYRADPTTLTPDMISDTIGTQMVGPRGERVEMQTEYPLFADIFHDAADQLGVSPAEAQSMAWFGFGDETNLASAPKTVADVFDERLDVTAQVMGISPEEAARLVFQRRIPLLGVGGAAVGTGLLSDPGQAQASPLSPEEEMIRFLQQIEAGQR